MGLRAPTAILRTMPKKFNSPLHEALRCGIIRYFRLNRPPISKIFCVRRAATGSHSLEAKDFAEAAQPPDHLSTYTTIGHTKVCPTTILIILDGKIRRKGGCRSSCPCPSVHKIFYAAQNIFAVDERVDLAYNHLLIYGYSQKDDDGTEAIE